jgi:hypothetical protein
VAIKVDREEHPDMDDAHGGDGDGDGAGYFKDTAHDAEQAGTGCRSCSPVTRATVGTSQCHVSWPARDGRPTS